MHALTCCRPRRSQLAQNYTYFRIQYAFQFPFPFATSSFAMEHVSIDGRRRNKYPTAAAAAAAAKLTRKSDPESSPNLRPASPPRLNPWASAKKPVASPLADVFPPLPKPHGLRSPATTPTSGVSRTSSLPPTISRSADDTEPAKNTLGSASPSSNASSSSRRIFEAAAPRAVEKFVELAPCTR